MATAREKVLRAHPTAKANTFKGWWQIGVPNVAPGMQMILSGCKRREDEAWSDAWRNIQAATEARDAYAEKVRR